MSEIARRTFAPDGSCTDGRGVSLRGHLLVAFYRSILKPAFPKRVDLAGARVSIAKLDARLGGRNPDFDQIDVDANGVPGEWVTTHEGTASRTILYLHGGGFMFRTPRTHARLAARLCSALDARAFIPKYRLAPEHPLPAAHEDCFAAYRWLLAGGHDPRRIVLIGDSAGGLLVLATLQRIRDAGLPAPSCGVMFSPGADLEAAQKLDANSAHRDPMIGVGMLELLQRVVIAPVNVRDPLISPCAGFLGSLPPLLFQAGSTELLLSQTVNAALQVRAGGGFAELQVWPKMPHVFQAVHWLPEAGEALESVRGFVERHASVVTEEHTTGPIVAAGADTNSTDINPTDQGPDSAPVLHHGS
ncbi:MAG: alpha/beta hydrolase [Burkholderiaceae bacterium]